MTTQPDDLLEEFEQSQPVYGTFWQRFFALFIDGLIMSPAVLIDQVNKSTWKSLPLLVFLSVITLVYKPVLETLYGATWGKMAIKLKVVNASFQQVGLKEVLMRNIFTIMGRIYMVLVALAVFSLPAFQQGVGNFTRLSNTVVNGQWYLALSALLMVVELICLLTDPQKRSLHDRIGQTFVVLK